MKISREVKTSVFVILALALFIWGYNFLKGNNILKVSTTYYGVCDSIAGLMEAAPIYMKGYKVGMVDDIHLSKETPGKIIVRYSFKEKIKIPEDSKAKIVGDGLLGSMAIELDMGKSKTYLDFGDTLNTVVPPGLLGGLMGKVEGITDGIDSVLFSVQQLLQEENRENIASIIKDLSNTMSTLDQNRGEIALILNNIEEFTASLKDKQDEIGNILTNFSSLSDSIADAEIKPAIHNANLALEQANKLLEDINNNNGTIGMLLNDSSLYTNLSNASNSLDSLLIDLKENPNRYVHISVFGGKEK